MAGYLGNTPAVALSSYIAPRVIDRYLHGVTIAVHGHLEWALEHQAFMGLLRTGEWACRRGQPRRLDPIVAAVWLARLARLLRAPHTLARGLPVLLVRGGALGLCGRHRRAQRQRDSLPRAGFRRHRRLGLRGDPER